MPRKATAGSFTKGDPRAGRPPGRANDITLEIRQFCRSLVQDPAYREGLRVRFIAGKAGDMEAYIWRMAYGSPPDRPLTSVSLLMEQITDLRPNGDPPPP